MYPLVFLVFLVFHLVNPAMVRLAAFLKSGFLLVFIFQSGFFGIKKPHLRGFMTILC